jgi:hypothetical protein
VFLGSLWRVFGVHNILPFASALRLSMGELATRDADAGIERGEAPMPAWWSTDWRRVSFESWSWENLKASVTDAIDHPNGPFVAAGVRSEDLDYRRLTPTYEAFVEVCLAPVAQVRVSFWLDAVHSHIIEQSRASQLQTGVIVSQLPGKSVHEATKTVRHARTFDAETYQTIDRSHLEGAGAAVSRMRQLFVVRIWGRGPRAKAHTHTCASLRPQTML